jgi:hypothetical protein
MPSVQITAKTTNAQTGQPATLFSPYNASLRLNVEYTLSADLVTLPNLQIGVIMEMIDLRTNHVFFYLAGQHPHPFGIGTQTYVYDINPSNTAGMNWGLGDIFGFRGALEVSGPSGAIDATAVSDIKWFRLQDMFEL